jgi:hypothetical protein
MSPSCIYIIETKHKGVAPIGDVRSVTIDHLSLETDLLVDAGSSKCILEDEKTGESDTRHEKRNKEPGPESIWYYFCLEVFW